MMQATVWPLILAQNSYVMQHECWSQATQIKPMDPILEQFTAINNRECGTYFLYMEHHAVIHTVHWGQWVTAVFHVTLVYNLLQYFDITLYTIVGQVAQSV